jgi:hypothetical protein
MIDDIQIFLIYQTAQDLISLQSGLAQEIFLMSLMGGMSVSGGVLTFSFFSIHHHHISCVAC